MRTSYRWTQYAKAGMVFAATTATYFFARATGFFPSWLNGGKNEKTDLVISDKVNNFIMEPIHSTQEYLLQQSSGFVVNSIPDQVIDVNQQYIYPLDDVFSGNFTLLGATGIGGNTLPSWLNLQYKLISTYIIAGGYASGIDVFGNSLFVASENTGLQILDVSDLDHPRLLSSYVDNTLPYFGVKVNGSYAFVVGSSGMQVIDVSNTSNPYLLSHFINGSGVAYNLAISGTLVYLANGPRGLQIVDVSNISNPYLLSTYPCGPGANTWDVAVLDRIAFVAVGSGLQILNVSDSTNPLLLSSYATPAGTSMGVAVSDNTLYLVICAVGLQVLDISNLTNPRLLSDYSAGVVGCATSVIVSYNTVMVADYAAGLQVWDSTDTSYLRLLSAYPSNGGQIQKVIMSGSTLFIADLAAGLLVLDMTQGNLMGVPPTQNIGQNIPISVSARDMGGILSLATFTLTLDQLPHNIVTTLSDESMFPSQSFSLSLNSNLLFTTTGKPFLKLSLQLLNHQPIPNWINTKLITFALSTSEAVTSALDVAVSGNYVFLVDGTGLRTFDVSDLTNPKLASTFYPDGSYGDARSLIVAGNTVFMAGGIHGLEIVDISNPVNPRLLSVYPAGANGRAVGIMLSDNTAFVANTVNLQILDVSNQNSPQLISTYTPTIGLAYGVTVSGPTIFLATWNGGLQILDGSNLLNPQLLSIYVTGSSDASRVAVTGSLALVANDGAGLQILDISNTSSPRLSSIYFVGSGRVHDVDVSGKTVFLASDIDGLQTLDVSNDTNPRLLSAYPAGAGQALSVAMANQTVFVADYTSGLQVLDVSQWQLTASPGTFDVGNYQLVLTATDELGGAASTQPFTIRVEGPPQIHGIIPTQYAKVGQPYHFFVPAGFFTDPNFDSIVFTATLLSGQTLPAWLSFNSISAAFAGTPFSQDVGGFSVNISATDNIAGSVNTTFQLYVDYLPVLNQPLSNQVAGVNILFQWTIPANTFFDPENEVLTYLALNSIGQPLPSWLQFNANTLQFLGTPTTVDANQYYELVVIASDPYQGQAQAPFSLFVEYFPQLNIPILPQIALVGSSYTLTVPVNTFLDAQSRTLSYRSLQTNGLTLPNWLGFNARTLIFTGVPQLSDVGTALLQLIATDPSGGVGQVNFNLTVTYQLVFNQPVSSQLVNVNTQFQFSFSNHTFLDPLGKSLIYSVLQSNGDSLPGWLKFNASFLQLFGITDSTAVGQYFLNVTAQNTIGVTAATTFSLQVEYFPQINRVIDPQWAQINQAFILIIPANAFIDAEGSLLMFKARQSNGAVLPNWLSFNSQTLIFSGVPQVTDAAKLVIGLIATDPVGGSAQQNFNLTVTQFPLLNQPIPSQLANINQWYQFTLPANLFSDPQNQLLSYELETQSGAALPAWLSFNATSRQLLGKPNRTQAGTYPLKILATNSDGASTSAWFSLIAEYFPQLNLPIISQWANINFPFSLTIGLNTFIDEEGDSLVYQARQWNGLQLPNWLSFNRQTLVFSGISQATDMGIVTIQLTATDSQGGSAQQVFNITATYFSVPGQSFSNPVAGIGLLYQWIIPTQIFVDPIGRPLTYAIRSSGESSLPNWLNFTASTRLLSGKPNVTQAGQYALEIIAQNVDGAQSSLPFSLLVEYFPYLNRVIGSQLAGVSQAFTFVVSADSFIDPDSSAILTYQASLVGGDDLPNWLTFNRQLLTFSGVPAVTDVGVAPIQLTVTDGQGGQAQTNFTISVVQLMNAAQQLTSTILRGNRSFSFQLPTNTFSNPNNYTLTYYATDKDGSALPGWLLFNGKNLSFAGTPPLAQVGNTLNLIITAQDSEGIQAAASLSLSIQPNSPPQVQQPISDQSANVGALFSFFVPQDTFIDPDGYSLSYLAQQSDGGTLPDWLKFNATGLSFSGIPGYGDTDVYALRRVGITLSASDGQAQASATFYINVGGLSYVALTLNIVSPLLSFFTALYAIYRERYLFLNRWKSNRYQKPMQSAQSGQTYEWRLGAPKEKVYRIQADIPRRKEGCCQFFQSEYRPLPAGKLLPSWMEYDPDLHCLRSKGVIPTGSPTRMRIQVTDVDGIILEQFEIHIHLGSPLSLEEKKGDQKETPIKRLGVHPVPHSDSSERWLLSPSIELEEPGANEIMPVPDRTDEVIMEDSDEEGSSVREESADMNRASTNPYALRASVGTMTASGERDKILTRLCT